jgi:hypothetical protein
MLSNRVYDALKWVILILLPAMGVFYMAMANTWGLPYGTEVTATIAAVDLFLAALLGISTNKFNITNPMYRLNLVKLVDNSKTTAWILSTNMYEFLTWTAQIFLPALITLYGGLSLVWPLPYPEQVASTLMAFDAFLGALLAFSTAQYHKLVAVELIENKNEIVINKGTGSP